MAAERRRIIWSVLFLVLSQSFGGTLQCVTSSSHPKDHSVRTENNLIDDYDSTTPDEAVSNGQGGPNDSSTLEEDTNEEGVSVPGLSDMEDPHFYRQARRENHGGPGGHSNTLTGKGESIRACNKRLRDALVTACEGQFHDPTSNFANSIGRADGTLRKARKRSMRKRAQEIVRRVPRSVVYNCCTNENGCSIEHLLTYCNQETPIHNSLTQPAKVEVIAAPTEGTPATELVETPEAEQNSVYVSPLFHIIHMFHRQLTKNIPMEVIPDERQAMSLPQARVQEEHSSSPSRQSTHSHHHSANNANPNFRKQPQPPVRFPYTLVEEPENVVNTFQTDLRHTNHQQIYNPPQETNGVNMDDGDEIEEPFYGNDENNVITSTLPSKLVKLKPKPRYG
ncbi:unnamed protein product [Orchesella dallaii]|uniref:Uncharacterized protein n=1 Tax=Orchesella dallaii TaxID=48710 RepID=A0ABP1PSD7_9HEXA